MKNLRIIFLLLIYFVSCSFALSQSEAVAQKFDEFNDVSDTQFYPFEEINLSQRIERFIKEIKRRRGVKIYIIHYRARKIDGEAGKYVSSNWAGRTSSDIQYKANLNPEDIIVIDGGYRERNSLEYWIGSKKAAPPQPTPTFDKSETFDCKTIYIYSNGRQFDKTRTLEFFVWKESFKPIEDFNFDWKVTAGEIVEGQGTNSIKVYLDDKNINRITAFVEVAGLPYPCEKVGYTTTEINKKPYLVDSAERYNFSDLSARVDSFMTLIYNEPEMRGYIVIYGARKGGGREMERAIMSVKRMFAFRGFDMSRVTLLRGGYREYNSVDMWVLPEGVEPPTSTPTVNEKFITPINKIKKKSVRRK